MKISAAREGDFDRIVEIWESSVRATHSFLSEADINFYRPLIRNQYLYNVWLFTAVDDSGRISAFMGLSPEEENNPARLEMLFVEAEAQRQGQGRLLVNHALGLYGTLELEVNEQNPGARLFYEKMGFVLTGREEVDGQGRPFPLLKMRR